MEFTTVVNGSGLEDLPENDTIFRCNQPSSFPPALGIHDSINQVQATIATATALVGLPMNIYLTIIILRYKTLHQRALFLSLQITIIEIVYHAVVPTTILTSGIMGTWVFGEFFCNVTGMIHDAFAMVRFSMTFVLTVDRFIYIFGPFFYSKYGGRVAWILSGLMWILSLLRICIPLYGLLDCYTYIPTFKTCTVFAGCSRSCEYFAAVSIGFIVISGVILPLILYVIIFVKVKQILKQHTTVSQNNSENVRRNIQQAFVKLQQRKKILITMFWLLVSIVGGTTPAFSLYIISLFYRVIDRRIFIINMLVGRTFFNCIPIFDAIAFTRHGDVRKTFTKCTWSNLTLPSAMIRCI